MSASQTRHDARLSFERIECFSRSDFIARRSGPPSALAQSSNDRPFRGKLEASTVFTVRYLWLPCVSLKRLVKRCFRDAAGVVRDRRRRDDGNYLKKQILAVPRRDELLDVLVAELTALVYQCSGQG